MCISVEVCKRFSLKVYKCGTELEVSKMFRNLCTWNFCKFASLQKCGNVEVWKCGIVQVWNFGGFSPLKKIPI